eukprot:662557-Prymnesium_polylepis.1
MPRSWPPLAKRPRLRPPRVARWRRPSAMAWAAGRGVMARAEPPSDKRGRTRLTPHPPRACTCGPACR